MNAVLNTLPTEEQRLIAPHLLGLDLHRDHLLVAQGGRLLHLYFPHQAVIAMRAHNVLGQAIELGLVAQNNVAGSHLMLGNHDAPYALVVVEAGSAQALPYDLLARHRAYLPTLWQRLQRCAHQQWTALAQHAADTAGAPLGWRLARLLHARFTASAQSELAITHAELAQLLHARRAGITQALHALEGLQAIRARRGLLILRDPQILARFIELGFTNPPHGVA